MPPEMLRISPQGGLFELGLSPRGPFILEPPLCKEAWICADSPLSLKPPLCKGRCRSYTAAEGLCFPNIFMIFRKLIILPRISNTLPVKYIPIKYIVGCTHEISRTHRALLLRPLRHRWSVLWTSRGNYCIVDSAVHLFEFRGSQHIDLYSRGYTAVLDAVSVPVQKHRRTAAGK